VSLFDILFARNRGTTLNATGQVAFGNQYAMTPWSFQRIANSVLANPTGGRAIHMVAENISRPDIVIVKPGTTEKIENSKLGALLSNPCPSVTGNAAMSSTMMMWRIGKDREVCGKSFWLKLRGRDGFGDKGPTTALKRMPPQRVTVVGNQDDELLGFIYRDRQGRTTAALPEDVLYFRYPHPERDYDGLAPALLAGLPAETDNAAARLPLDRGADHGGVPQVEGALGSGREPRQGADARREGCHLHEDRPIQLGADVLGTPL
jgi:phage portal protein BeeE